MDAEQRSRQIEHHLEQIRRLQAESSDQSDEGGWPPSGFYLPWHLLVGMALGALGAAVSLTANIVGAPLFGQHPLQLIRSYLTFPMGERALTADEGLLLTVGVSLYLLTGAVFGVVLHFVLTLYFAEASPLKRFLVATVIGLALWIVGFYFILSWLQPLLLGGNWIVATVPWWVGALTHLAFAWTVALAEHWGRFDAPQHARA